MTYSKTSEDIPWFAKEQQHENGSSLTTESQWPVFQRLNLFCLTPVRIPVSVGLSLKPVIKNYHLQAFASLQGFETNNRLWSCFWCEGRQRSFAACCNQRTCDVLSRERFGGRSQLIQVAACHWSPIQGLQINMSEVSRQFDWRFLMARFGIRLRAQSSHRV